MITARALIIKRLYESGVPLPVHALDIPQVSPTAASARLREMRRDGIVQKVKAPGQRYDLWRLTPSQPTFPFEQEQA